MGKDLPSLFIGQLSHLHLTYRKIIPFNEANDLSKLCANIRFYQSKYFPPFHSSLAFSEFISIGFNLKIPGIYPNCISNV